MCMKKIPLIFRMPTFLLLASIALHAERGFSWYGAICSSGGAGGQSGDFTVWCDGTYYRSLTLNYTITENMFLGYSSQDRWTAYWNGVAFASNPRASSPSYGFNGGQNVPIRFAWSLNPGRNVTTSNISVNGTKDPPNPQSSYSASLTVQPNTTSAWTSFSSDPQGAPLSPTLGTAPTKGTLEWSGASFRYTPNAWTSGTDSFTYRVTETVRYQTSAWITVNITVPFINSSPTFTLGNNININQDSPAQTLTNFLTGIYPGDSSKPDEWSQTVSFTVSNTNTGLFSVQPSINAVSFTNSAVNSNLTFTPAPCKYGTATVSVTAVDSLGLASTAKNFTITIAKVDYPPSIQAISEASVNWYSPENVVPLYGIAAGNCGTALTISASSSNQSIIAAPVVNYTSPASTALISLRPVSKTPSQQSISQITVTVSDSVNSPRTMTFPAKLKWVNLLRR